MVFHVEKKMGELAILNRKEDEKEDETSSSDSDSEGSGDEFNGDQTDHSKSWLTEDLDNEGIEGDLQLDIELFKRIPCRYTNIIGEFADVEVFAIGVESLLIEFTAHKYHNWQLGGQTIVLCRQIDRFLDSLERFGAKFKLVWFSDLLPLFDKIPYLSFLHSVVLAHLGSNEKWCGCLERFSSPLDQRWNEYLHKLTPSFIIMSVENPTDSLVKENIDFASRFIGTAIHLIEAGIPVVLFDSFKVNLSSVTAFRMSIVPLCIANLRHKLTEIWSNRFEFRERKSFPELRDCRSVADFWAVVIRKERKEGKDKKNKEFDLFCAAVLISAVVCEKMGTSRKYLSSEKESRCINLARRILCEAASRRLISLDPKDIKFSLADVWDGRMIKGIYENIDKKNKILPENLREEFYRILKSAGLSVTLQVDPTGALLESNKILTDRPPEHKIFEVKCELINEFVPEFKQIQERCPKCQHEQFQAAEFVRQWNWKFTAVPVELFIPKANKAADYLKSEEYAKLDSRDQRKARKKVKLELRARQQNARWFQNFADSLEGRANDLVVDFARSPRLPATEESDVSVKPSYDVSTKNRVNKSSKAPQLSKKDQIVLKNKDALKKKQLSDDKIKIEFAAAVKAKEVSSLKDLLRSLELEESKAFCVYQIMLIHAEIYIAKLPLIETLEQKRNAALDLVEVIKDCFVKHISFLDEKQKQKVHYYWRSLGFSSKCAVDRVDGNMNLGMNLVDYQLYHGGRFIDILSDPRKDDRVVAFHPDEWQRRMLSSVDDFQSALIVAPTSAGKTFVSYYCIEKVLRIGGEEVVVFVAPAKALMYQVIGSVYARFKNKPMVNGKALFGHATWDFYENVLDCQVLITIPDVFESMLLSSDPHVQQFISRLKYVIVDEVHCINADQSDQRLKGHFIERIFLLIRCPFLALSATIGNVSDVHSWLQMVECNKNQGREVRLIEYDERWAELDQSIHQMMECPKEVSYSDDRNIFSNKHGLQTRKDVDSSVTSENIMSPMSAPGSTIESFHPYSVFNIEKLRMFGIPTDQQLTARQLVTLYSVMAQVDEQTKSDFEPSKFFGYSATTNVPVWLTRKGLREYENALKNRFLQWLKNDEEKCVMVISQLGIVATKELEKRSKPFNMTKTALHNIMSLMDDLKRTDRLPSICFSDDREICENLAIRVFNELEMREIAWRASPDFHQKFNLKAEEKAEKLAKRKRDEEEKEKKRRKKAIVGEDGRREGQRFEVDDDDTSVDPSALQKIKLENELKKFKFLARFSDEDLYKNTIKRMLGSKSRKSSHELVRLFSRGVGYHHDGMTSRERSAVEILFRAGFLGVVFSTSTLALGMNMPCKCVVFGIDTPMLTPLQFRQMAGRAGRRGFDSTGTVVFMSLPTGKIRRLLTSKLANLRGNIPYNTSFILRLLKFVQGDLIEKSDEKSELTKREVATNSFVLDTRGLRVKVALDVLRMPFVLRTTLRDHESGSAYLRFLVLFSVQLLRKCQFLNEECQLTSFAYLAEQLSAYQPGNLVFAVVVQSGALHRLFRQYKRDDKLTAFKSVFINILAHLFTNMPLPPHAFGPEDDLENEPVLKKMPDEIVDVVQQYSRDVNQLFFAFLKLSCPKMGTEDPFLSLSGRDGQLNIYDVDLVSKFPGELLLDDVFIPAFSMDRLDHRGRKILRNSYAIDFWKNGSARKLIHENKCLISDIWYLIHDFDNILGAISETLKLWSSGARKTDELSNFVQEVAKEFRSKFHRGFAMKEEKEDD